jgi:hypothetical protein
MVVSRGWSVLWIQGLPCLKAAVDRDLAALRALLCRCSCLGNALCRGLIKLPDPPRNRPLVQHHWLLARCQRPAKAEK